VRDSFHEACGAKLGEVVSKRSQTVLVGRIVESRRSAGIDLCRCERALRSDMAEEDHGVHQGQLPGMVQLQAGNTLALR
jgi:hypothetical protein